MSRGNNEVKRVSIMGNKVSMTQLFLRNGYIIPVTAIYVAPNVVSLIKNIKSDGYSSVQIAHGDCKEKKISHPIFSSLKLRNISPKMNLKEFRTSDSSEYHTGQILNLDIFKEGEKIKVSGYSKGKGFSGVIARHNQSRGPSSHGSGFHRKPGSMGPIAPNRVMKGKKLPGRMGNENVSVINLLIMKIDSVNNIMYVKGSVPGNRGGLLTITKIVG